MESFKANVDVEKNQLLEMRKEIEDDHERKKVELEAMRADIDNQPTKLRGYVAKAGPFSISPPKHLAHNEFDLFNRDKGGRNDYISGSELRVNMGSSSTEDTADMSYIEYVMSLRIPLKEIASATNNFADENIIERGSYALVYKGALSDHSSGDLINVVYMDPAFETTGRLTHKSDVFSFGVLLFEVLFGTKASVQQGDNWYFAKMARRCYDDKRLDDMIDHDLRKQMDTQSLKLFSETAYFCLKEQRAQRPDMEQIVKILDKALEIHQSFVRPTAIVEDASSNPLKEGHMDHLKLPLKEIIQATENFSERYLVGSGGYGKVYKAELKYFDGSRSVAIKQIVKKGDTYAQHGFIAEIEMLSKCKHTNIISLVGFCDEDDEMIIIYEYASNGSLDGYLKKVDKMTNLTWAQRIKICIDIANGLHYLGENQIVHRDIKSENILLDDKWVAKIADFGLSKSHQQQVGTLVTSNIAGTPFYLDPVYEKEGKLKLKSDIYSFGVVLFEILCGRLAYDVSFNGMGLAAAARLAYQNGTLNKLIDPKIKEADEDIFISNEGVNQLSLDKFSDIAYKCIAESQNDRPTIEDVIKELKEALYYQENNKGNLHISVEVIKLGTDNFSDCKCIGEGRYWKQYAGEILHADKHITVVAKRWDNKSPQTRHQFLTELQILSQYKHENIISLVGYCNEGGERIIVYESASNGSLDKHLANASLSWIKRLKIFIDVAKGLEFLHTSVSRMHWGIKSASILLDGDWKAKISNLELSAQLSSMESIHDHITDDNAYVFEDNIELGFLTKESDIFSLGVVIKEMFMGIPVRYDHLRLYVYYSDGKEILQHRDAFEGIREQIDPKTFKTLADIASLCLTYESFRPDATELITQLGKALEFQEDYEKWEPRLPVDYQKIIQMSKTPELYQSIEMRRDLYNMFLKGILLQDGKLWFSIGTDGERNEMISARKFSYRNRRSHKWRSAEGSRFPKVAEITDISNLKIQIKMKKQFISPSVNHKVYLIFRVCGPRKSQAKRMYVNLKYKTGNETLHAYFATWREDGWMMIELFQSLNHKEDTDFEVLLESFSRCYCGSSSIYIEGIEFQAIDNVNHEETKGFKEVQKVDLDTEKVKKQHIEEQEMMLSAKKVVYTSSDMMNPDRFDGRISQQHQVYHDSIIFRGAIEFLRHHVFRIRYKIQRQMLSANTKNVCYLVFKLSEKSRGLHGPVIVRDLFHQKETRILYFRSPNPSNINDSDSIPEKREDGWLEVILWIFNSDYELKSDHLFVNLKLVTYEGTMSGLIVRGIEFRPI
ncbi:hypothetical protein E3N88_14340 [Mikania micrantha]|uniref:non-specific serine/threonine protein kinase n=1 Tax=Mikania micrantha TaxID=192012 RepID=A0A5N6P147_9ASTR|nr:hypothetical protein E3N88_14340 [Mikania micrantha]